MKTPDEIKKGLECCAASIYQCADDCPYRGECRNKKSSMVLKKDALAYIQRLEKDNDHLYNYIRLLQAERDAALADFKLYRERNIKGECGVYACDLCKLGGWEDFKCPKGCMGIKYWQWRGVQKEE